MMSREKFLAGSLQEEVGEEGGEELLEWGGPWGQPVPPQAWVIPNLLPARGVTLLCGQGGVGKSLLSLQLAVASAAGVPRWVASPSADNPVPELDMGYALVGHTVVYATYEDKREMVQRRVQGFVSADQRDRARLSEGVGWHDLGGARAGWTLTDALDTDPSLFYCPVTGPLWHYDQTVRRGAWTKTGRNLWNIVAARRQSRSALLIVDPVAMAWDGNENVRSEVGAFLVALERRAEEEDTTVLVVGHPPKLSGHVYSGSTAWVNTPRMVWSLGEAPTSIPVEPEGKGKGKDPPAAMQLSVVKSNYGPLVSWWLQRTRELWRGASERDAAIAHWLSSGKGRLPESLGGHPMKGGA